MIENQATDVSPEFLPRSARFSGSRDAEKLKFKFSVTEMPKFFVSNIFVDRKKISNVVISMANAERKSSSAESWFFTNPCRVHCRSRIFIIRNVTIVQNTLRQWEPRKMIENRRGKHSEITKIQGNLPSGPFSLPSVRFRTCLAGSSGILPRFSVVESSLRLSGGGAVLRGDFYDGAGWILMKYQLQSIRRGQSAASNRSSSDFLSWQVEIHPAPS